MSNLTVMDSKTAWGGNNVSPYGASYGKLMMWFFLISDALTFTGFLSAYGFYRHYYSSIWPSAENVFTHFPFMHGNHPLLYVALMTFILIMSSVTMVLAVEAGHRMDKKGVNEMKNKELKSLVKQVLQEYSLAGPINNYQNNMGASNKEENDFEEYLKEWEEFTSEIVQDSTRGNAIKLAKMLIEDSELLEDILETLGARQEVAEEVMDQFKSLDKDEKDDPDPDIQREDWQS